MCTSTLDDPLPIEVLISTVAALLEGVRHVAVGASSPIPGAGALLARALSCNLADTTPCAQRLGTPEADLEADSGVRSLPRSRRVRVSILGSRRHHAMTNGGVELFDLAATGRIDAFFLGGGQIDAAANINLVGIGDYPTTLTRWPGSFGSAYLYHLVRRVILFRLEHSRRVFVPRVDFVSACGSSPEGEYRPGGPIALLTGLCLFRFDRNRRRFVLQSVHPPHTLEEVRDQTGFDFDLAPGLAATPLPGDQALALMRGAIREEIAETYPEFARTWSQSLETGGDRSETVAKIGAALQG